MPKKEFERKIDNCKTYSMSHTFEKLFEKMISKKQILALKKMMKHEDQDNNVI